LDERFGTVVVDIAKLRDYCLSGTHPRGRHKARVFRTRLGLTTRNAASRRRAFLKAGRDRQGDLRPAGADQYGRTLRPRCQRDRSRRNRGGSVRLDCPNRRGRVTIRQLLRALRERATAPAIQVLNVVALTVDLPDKGVWRGQVGTVVESLSPGVFEVEFSDDDGRTYAQLALRDDQLMVLCYQPERAA
jgi:hypothetical protein